MAIAQFLYGATPELSIGAFYTTNSGDIDGSDDVSLRASHYGVAAQYKLDPMFFVQGRAGFSSIEISSDRFNATVKSEKHPFILGAGFGAELPINSMISFAPFVNYTHSFKAGSDTDPDGKVESYGLIEVMGVVRFNF